MFLCLLSNMASSQPKPKTNQLPATKRFLDIAEIRDDSVIMRDGGLRSVLLVSSINFYLKSEDEQTAIISAYVSFLNSLDEPIQITIQSRKLNVDAYLLQLKERAEKHTSSLLREQTEAYHDFIKQLIDLGDIMSRRYFVTIPYYPSSQKNKGFFKRMGELWSPSVAIKLKEEKFQQYRYELDLRVQRIIGGLSSMGLQVTRLDTQSLIELYYMTYNPDLAEVQKMVGIEDLQVEAQ